MGVVVGDTAVADTVVLAVACVVIYDGVILLCV